MGDGIPAAPTQIEDIGAMLRELLARGEHERLIEVVRELFAKMLRDNHELGRQLAKALRRAAGHRSEKLDPRQLWLAMAQALAQQEQPQPAPPPPAPREKPPRAPRKPTGRKPLPAHLPREVVRMSVPREQQTCACGKETRPMGVETSEVLDYVPASLKVIVIEREKRGCPDGVCGVVIAPAADKAIDKGLPGSGLLAQVLVSKYADHQPLNRQVAMFARQGVELAPSTLCDWVRQGVEILEPVCEAIFSEVLASHVMQGDDTGLRVLDNGAPGGSKKGHLWAFVGDRVWVAFRYTETWKGEEARAHVRERRGWFQVDGYAGFDAMFNAKPPAVFEVGCWAHARRKYVEALEGGDVRAALAITTIAKLFAIEHDADARGLDAGARLDLRHEKSVDVLNDLTRWVAETVPRAPPKTPLGQALTYQINQRVQLRRFLEDGRLELTNNLAPSGRCAPWPWGATTGCSPGRTPARDARPCSTRSSARVGSTAWTRGRTCATCSTSSPRPGRCGGCASCCPTRGRGRVRRLRPPRRRRRRRPPCRSSGAYGAA